MSPQDRRERRLPALRHGRERHQPPVASPTTSPNPAQSCRRRRPQRSSATPRTTRSKPATTSTSAAISPHSRSTSPGVCMPSTTAGPSRPRTANRSSTPSTSTIRRWARGPATARRRSTSSRTPAGRSTTTSSTRRRDRSRSSITSNSTPTRTERHRRPEIRSSGPAAERVRHSHPVRRPAARKPLTNGGGVDGAAVYGGDLSRLLSATSGRVVAEGVRIAPDEDEASDRPVRVRPPSSAVAVVGAASDNAPASHPFRQPGLFIASCRHCSSSRRCLEVRRSLTRSGD